MSRTYAIPSPLAILPLPPGQVLFPSSVMSIQLVRKDSIALLKSVMHDAEQHPGNRSVIIGCAPLRHSDSKPAKSKAVKPRDPYRTPPSSDDDSSSSSSDSFKVIKVGAQDGNGNQPKREDIFEYGTAARIIRLERLNAGGFLAVVEGLCRIKIDTYLSHAVSSFYEARVKALPSEPLPASSMHLVDSLSKVASSLISTVAQSAPLPPLLTRRLKTLIANLNAENAGPLVDALVASLSPAAGLDYADKLRILSLVDTTERVKDAVDVLGRVDESLNVRKRIGEKVESSLSRKQREFILMQQLAAIKQELDELAAKDGRKGPSIPGLNGGPGEDGEEEADEMAELEKKIKEKNWTAEAKKTALREFGRLKKSPPQGAEHGVIRNYIDWLLAIPWTEATPMPLTTDFISAARTKLDDDHYGLDKVKKRLLEWLAVLRLKMEIAAAEEPKKEQLAIEEGAAETAIEAVPSGSTPTEAAGSVDGPVAPPSRQPVNDDTAPPPRPDKSPILLLCGPPGTGKTSIARSLAESMGRKFYRISLGGVRDEAEIRGHRRTYVAALPGAIAQALRKTGVRNPVILLDEIDKLGMSSTHGDPAAALLEVLDPEQNWCFMDHYLGVPLDLSSVLFIATANSLDTISDPLFDRMEVIELPGYVHDEKLHIAKKYLIPKQLKANVLPQDMLEMSDEVILHLITNYTREAGVRTTEREIGSVIRAKAVEYAEARDKAVQAGQAATDVLKHGYTPTVTKDDLEQILGVPRYEPEALDREMTVGVAHGLAYQGSGNGGILHIESTTMPGTGRFHLTGQLGDVISESAKLAFAWVKAHAYELGISPSRDEDIFKHLDVHVHLPSGAVKKDGPSAGVAMVVAMVSLMRGIKTIKRLAMTGEITLRGNVTPVGGIKEKVLAAHRAGIKTLLLPYKNEKDVKADLPQVVRDEVRIIYVRTIWEALEGAFGAQLWDGAHGERLRIRSAESESRL